MAIQTPPMVHHGLPLWSELLGAAIIGAAILLGVLLAAGHSDILPWNATETTPTTSSWMMDDPAPIPPWAR
jgi:hypothetical protein